MFNPMPDISQRAIIIFYVCVVVFIRLQLQYKSSQ